MATLVAGAMIAQQIGGKAARDAFFLSQFDISALPTMMVVSALVSIAAVQAVMGRRPALVVPWGFAVSGVLLLAEWTFAGTQPRIVAAALYLHIAVFGAVLISGFWSLVTDSFDPHTARRRMGQIATGASVGAVIGGLLVERIGALSSVTSAFPVLALLHFGCAALVVRLLPRASKSPATSLDEAGGVRAGMRVFARLPYLRNLAYLVFVGAASAALLDYAFKAEVSAALTDGEAMMRFFALFYTGVGIVTLAIQSAASARSLERFGLAGTAASLPAAVVVGSLGMLLVPGLAIALVARAGEATFRSSLFRSGYELFYTPVSPRDKRATKTAIDVIWERLGDVTGGVAAKGLLLLSPVVARSAILALVAGLGALGLWICRRLHAGYVEALEARLLDKEARSAAEGGAAAINLDQSQLHSALFSVAGGLSVISEAPLLPADDDNDSDNAAADSSESATLVVQDPLHQAFLDLRSGDPERVRRVLAKTPLDSLLVPQVIPLLGRDDVAHAARRALLPMVEQIAGQLGDVLADAGADLVVRRRIPSVLSRGGERAAAVLLASLGDQKFGVRYRCGRALQRLQSSEIEMSLSTQDVVNLVLDEVDRNRRVLEGNHQLADPQGNHREHEVEFNELVRQRAHRRLAHIFHLLALRFPREPLRIAFRGIEADDAHLRGTSLEYLDSLLPAEIRDPIWPFLTREPAKHLPPRPREEIVEDLLKSSMYLEIQPEEDDQ